MKAMKLLCSRITAHKPLPVLSHQVILLASLAVVLVTSNSQPKEENGPSSPGPHYRADNAPPNAKFYVDKKGSTVIEIGPEKDCHVYDGDDADWMRRLKSDRMTELNYFQFRLMLGKCRLGALFKPLEFEWKTNNDNNNANSHSNDNSNATKTEPRDSNSHQFAETNEFPQSNSSDVHDTNQDDDFFYNTTPGSRFSLIFPGTLWCGKGSAAKRKWELGLYSETDKCCREHDQCDENMNGKSCKYGICNDSDYTRSHCECDDMFRYCLQQDRSLSSIASFKIANLYFNILKPPCYAHRHPVKFCKKHRITGECVEFEYNYDYEPIWQFFPAQPYPTVSDVVDKIINPAPPPPPENGPNPPPGPPPGPPGPPPPDSPSIIITGIRPPDEEEEEGNENGDHREK